MDTRQIRFNLWVFWHHVRLHKLEAEIKTLEYPLVQQTVICKTCNRGKIITYADGLENYYQ